jgi:hypothetical protein
MFGLPNDLITRFTGQGWEGVQELLTAETDAGHTPRAKMLSLLNTGSQALTQVCTTWSGRRQEEQKDNVVATYTSLSVIVQSLAALFETSVVTQLVAKLDEVHAFHDGKPTLEGSPVIDSLKNIVSAQRESLHLEVTRVETAVKGLQDLRPKLKYVPANQCTAPSNTVLPDIWQYLAIGCSLCDLQAKPVDPKAIAVTAFLLTDSKAVKPSETKLSYLEAVCKFMEAHGKLDGGGSTGIKRMGLQTEALRQNPLPTKHPLNELDPGPKLPNTLCAGQINTTDRMRGK